MIRQDYKAAWNEHSAKCICSTPELIENYDKAIADTTQTWVCHHRLETHTSDGILREIEISDEELKSLGVYYNRPPEELIFMTRSEHRKLHKSGSFKKGHSVDKQKISETTKKAMENVDMKSIMRFWSENNKYKVQEQRKKNLQDKGKELLRKKPLWKIYVGSFDSTSHRWNRLFRL